MKKLTRSVLNKMIEEERSRIDQEKVQITSEEKSQDLDGPLNHLKSLKAEEQKLREKLSEVQKMKRTLKGKILKEVQG